MKVLHFIESLGRGGAEQLLVTLLPELQRQNVSAVVVVRAGNMDLVSELQSRGIFVHCLKQRHRWNLVGSARELSGIVRNESADIIHGHLYFPAVTIALMKILRFCRAPSCVTFHNLAYAGANRAGIKLTGRRLLARVLYRAGIDSFFGVSDAVARHYEKKLGLATVKVIPNPVDFSVIKESGAADMATTADLVLAGRIVPEKGHSDLLEALWKLASEGSHPSLVIAGEGPLRGAIEALAEDLGLRQQITFTGALAHMDLLRALGSAKVAIIPSRFEGFGLVALEAMALGRSTIVSDAGGLPEVVGDTAVVVPVGDTSSMAGAISALLADPERQAEMGKRAAMRAMNFDLPYVAEKQIMAYRELLGDHLRQGD
ncbi:glycosyltransferase family 4 protein [Marimonas sp. MJW-29]|uniref:Glycosyltransferase family 4 protein n=1 Tax=Sulfitobacter sediminis TaxID=3234186 RepID=A0ABV3RPQ7_9RHOB